MIKWSSKIILYAEKNDVIWHNILRHNFHIILHSTFKGILYTVDCFQIQKFKSTFPKYTILCIFFLHIYNFSYSILKY